MKNTVFFAILALFAGCASQELGPQNSTQTSQNSPASVDSLSQEIDQAREEGLPYLAPMAFLQAEQALQAAQKAQKTDNLEEAKTQLATGFHQLKTARAFAASAKTLLPEAISERTKAIQVFAQARDQNTLDIAELTDDIGLVEESFRKLTVAIEQNQVANATANAKDVASEFRKFRIAALKSVTLDPALRTYNQAVQEGAKKYAPKSVQAAQTKMDSAEAFITLNPEDLPAIKERGEQALFYANRSLTLTLESKKIANKSPEEVSLWIENQLGRISTLVSPDLRDKKFDDQVGQIQNSIVVLQSRQRGLAQEKQALTERQEELQSEKKQLRSNIEALNEKLEADEYIVRRTEKFKQVKELFQKDEAEVVTEGENIIVRLRAIQFPVGKAVLLPDNYPLLSKVQKAIKLFSEPQITVEGHTDSVGSAEINKELSLKRAASVKDYLVANETISRSRIKIAGMGFAKPLTADRTPEGRAINRRIDVIIHFPQ